MKKINVFLVLLFISTASSISAVCPGSTGSVAKIVCLADSLKAILTSTQISTLQLSYAYTNSQNWSNLPTTMQPRIGIKLGTLTATQLAIAKALVQEVSGTTVNEGYDEAQQLMLADDFLSANGGGADYGAGLYYLCFNGTPSLTGLFSIKFGGHHLQIENTYNKGVMVGGTPHFEAIEPLTFTSGGNTYSTITQEKNALAAMFSTLSSTELSTAKLSGTFTDVLMGAKNSGSYKDWIFPATKLGLKVGNLTAPQKKLVLDAIKTYVLDLDDVNANAIINQYTQELDATYISYAGNTNLATKNDYVRIDGPGVWIEFTVQGGIIMSGVHYHSIWRDHRRDYGGAGSTNGVYVIPVGGDVTTGISNSQNRDLQYVQFFPNPTQDILNIQFTLTIAANTKIYCVDALGKTVISGAASHFNAGNHSVIYNLSSLQAGIYYVIIETNQHRSSSKIIKQ